MAGSRDCRHDDRPHRSPPRPLGVQLYTVRNILMKEPDRVLKTIAEIGYTEIEGNRTDLIELLPKIQQYGLKPVSCHIETPLITKTWDLYPDLREIRLEDAIDSAKKIGVSYFTLAYISPGARGDGDDFFRRTADRMNAAGELCKKAGCKWHIIITPMNLAADQGCGRSIYFSTGWILCW